MQLHVEAFDRARAFLGWWASELAGLLPDTARAPIAGARMVLAEQGCGVMVYAERADSVRELLAEPVPVQALHTVLPRLIAERGRQALGIRLRYSDCFVRDLELPVAVQQDLDRILALDLERSTPFKSEAVYAGSYISGPAPSRNSIRVRHFIAKRKQADARIEDLRRAGFEPAFVDVWNEAGTAGLPVNLICHVPARERRSWRPILTLGLACVVLIFTATGSALVQKWSALAALDAEARRLQPIADAARQSLDRARLSEQERLLLLRLLRGRPPATAILDDLSRLLPDSVWLQELRLRGDLIELSGMAPSAASLLPLIERSGLYHEAQLTSPVRLVEEDRELFRMRVKLKGAELPIPTDAVEQNQ